MQVDTQIIRFVKRVRKRLQTVRLLRTLEYGALFGIGLGCIPLLMSLWIPMYYASLYAIGIIVVCVVGSLIVTGVTAPSMKQAALTLDSHGLQERLITAFELAGKEDTFSMLQKQDTITRLQGMNMREEFPVRISWKRLGMTVGMLAIFGVILTIPTASKEVALEQHQVAEQVKEEQKKIEDQKKKVEQADGLTKEERDQLLEALQKTSMELGEAKNEEALAKEKERAELKLEQVAQSIKDKEISRQIEDLAYGGRV